MRSSLLVAFLAVILWPSLAAACACCDGGEVREIVGWSESGGTALVRRRSVGCEDLLALEIWRRGNPQPIGCFDLYGDDPNRRVACDQLEYGFDRFGDDEERPTTSTRAADFPGRAEQIAASHVRATLRPNGEVPDSYVPLFALEVSVLASNTWTSVYQRDVVLGRPEDGRGPEDYSPAERIVMNSPLPVEVRIWPSPTGRHALVEVSGYNDDPSMGFWPDALAWVVLPAGLLRVQPAEEELTLAVPAFTPRPEPGGRAAARRVNRAGLDAHGRGDFASSANFFAMATLTDPSSPMPRYNLACALARQGRLDAALILLSEIAASGCSQCAERMERARVDPDLAALASRLP